MTVKAGEKFGRIDLDHTEYEIQVDRGEMGVWIYKDGSPLKHFTASELAEAATEHFEVEE